MNVFQKDKLYTGAFFTPLAFLMGGPAGVLSVAALTALSIKLDGINKPEPSEFYKQHMYVEKTEEEWEELRRQHWIAYTKINEIRKLETTTMITKKDVPYIHCTKPNQWKYAGYEGKITFGKAWMVEETKKTIFLYNDPIEFLNIMEEYARDFDGVQCFYIQGGLDPYLFFKPYGQYKRNPDLVFDKYVGYMTI